MGPPCNISSVDGLCFTDSTSGTNASDYSATIDWGDGNTSNGIITSDGSGGFNVTGTNTYFSAGTFNPIVNIYDPSGASATVTATANVSGLAATNDTVNAIQSDSFTGVLANFTDTASDASSVTYTASINWGGSTSSGTVASDGSGGFNVTATKTFSTLGQFNVTVTIDASDGRSIAAVSTVDVSTLTVTGQTISAVAGESYTGEVATFTDSVSGTSAGDYTVSINWGDGNTSTGTVAISDSEFTVTGTNTFASSGSLSPTVTINQSSGGTAATAAAMTVAALDAPTLSAIAASDSVINLTFTDPATDGASLELEEMGPGDIDFHNISIPTESGGVYPITTGLTADSAYSFRLRAALNGMVAYSATQTVITTVGSDAPTITESSYDSTTNEIYLQWTESNPDAYVTIFENTVEPGLETGFQIFGEVGGSTTSAYMVPGGEDGNLPFLYDAPEDMGFNSCQFYVVCSYSGEIAASNVVTVQTPPQLAAPTLSESSDGTNVTFSWNAIAGADNYVLESFPGSYPVANNASGVYQGDSSTTSYTMSAADASDALFAVEAEKDNSDEDGLPYFAASNLVGSISSSAPATPDNLSATVVSGSQINLIWNNNSNNETGFDIYRNTTNDPDSAELIGSTGANDFMYSDTDRLEGGQRYYYWVQAINDNNTSPDNESDFSSEADTAIAAVSVVTVQNGSLDGPTPVIFNISRTGSTSDSMTVYYKLSGTAVAGPELEPTDDISTDGSDYTGAKPATGNTGLYQITIAAGNSSALLVLTPEYKNNLSNDPSTIDIQLVQSPFQGTGIGEIYADAPTTGPSPTTQPSATTQADITHDTVTYEPGGKPFAALGQKGVLQLLTVFKNQLNLTIPQLQTKTFLGWSGSLNGATTGIFLAVNKVTVKGNAASIWQKVDISNEVYNAQGAKISLDPNDPQYGSLFPPTSVEGFSVKNGETQDFDLHAITRRLLPGWNKIIVTKTITTIAGTYNGHNVTGTYELPDNGKGDWSKIEASSPPITMTITLTLYANGNWTFECKELNIDEHNP